MKSFKALLYISTIMGIVMMTSCSDDDPIIENEEELITTVIYRMSPVGGGSDVEFQFSDPDGDGGEAPTISSEALAANTAYTGSLIFLDESGEETEDITEEIEEEDEEHQVFYVVTGNSLQISYNDMDEDGNPIGLSTTVNATDSGTGNLTIILRHEPIKTNSGVADGDPTNAEGETDIEVTFNYTVE